LKQLIKTVLIKHRNSMTLNYIKTTQKRLKL